MKLTQHPSFIVGKKLILPKINVHIYLNRYTSRTEHFPEAKESRSLLNAELQASTAALTGEPPRFEVLELQKFDDEQIRQVLSFRATPIIVKKVMENYQLLDLARRPLMIEIILEALPDIDAGKPVDLSRVYMYAVRRKMEGDIKEERTFTSLADKLYFLCELSFEMLSTDQMSLNYRLFPDRLRHLFGQTVEEQKELDHWHYDMMGQTMLIRNADGDYTPAHRSFLEFFAAYKFAAELGILAPDFCELAQKQSHIDKSTMPKSFTWSSYFKREVDKNGIIKPIPPLQTFLKTEINKLIETFGKRPLTKAILDLIQNMLSSDEDKVKASLLNIIEGTRHKETDKIGFIGGNAASVLVRYDRFALRGHDLSAISLCHANLHRADLTGCTLHRADLSKVHFEDTIMVDAILSESIMEGVDLHIYDGWISKSGQVYFYYDHIEHHEYPLLPFKIQEKEVVIGAEENGVLKWTVRIPTIFIAEWRFEKETLQLLTIEGEVISLNLENGDKIPINDKRALLRWIHSDLTDVKGLDDRNTYFLKIMGAVNLPATSYDPRDEPYILRFQNKSEKKKS